ncbi:hypothetical protein OIV83_004334 [Microbotryomycetes sp. JL201]|nr:hypothetical protein OIV83_004291 [Microbotryomycetes sp. JL201]KAK4049186.1 hypothetical protein OIV83_004334 [Microbotryomycetes sp. JL201]
MDRPTPRLNSARLGDYIGRNVRIVGKVISRDGDTVTLELSDKGQVQVKLNRDSNHRDAYVEVIGRVERLDLVQELTSCNMGDQIDMDLMDRVVELTHNFTDIFPTQ